MNATYQDEYGEYVPCRLLAHSLDGMKALIEIDDELGWCSSHIVETEED